MQLQPIGTLATPWASRAECPRNGRQPDPVPGCFAHIDDAYAEGLLGLDGFTHLILLYWLHQPIPAALVFTPPFATQPRGIFATRAPHRPNPIGLSVVAFDGFETPTCLRVRYLEGVDGTPLLDIKPYLPSTDAEPQASMGWLEPGNRRVL